VRPRAIELHPKTIDKLRRLKKEGEEEGAYRVAKRIHAVLLCAQGRTSGEITTLVDAPRSCVAEWLRNYEEHGYEGLLEGHRSGRPSRLSEKQKELLSDIIESGPVAYGFLSGVWTSIMISKVIQEEFSIEFHPGHVRKLLYALDFSVQRPKRVLANADPAKQHKWRRYTYPNLKKKRKTKARH
jgi:transposase